MTIKISNVTFVIITKNESFGVRKCFSALQSLSLSNCEIICIDSDSTDDTLDYIKCVSTRFDCISLYQCKGFLNAAVGRQIGLQKATLPFVFFMDGDIEINPGFLHAALSIFQNRLDVIAITGGLQEVVYNHDYSSALRFDVRTSYENEQLICHSGGTFIARSSATRKIGSWDIRLKASEDRDFIARMCEFGDIIGIPELMGTHHTKPYADTFWGELGSRHYCCLGMFLRKHFWNAKQWYSIIKVDPAPFFGSFVYVLLLVGWILSHPLKHNFLLAYISAMLFIVGDTLLGVIKGKDMMYRFFSRYIRPFYVLIGLFYNFKGSFKDVSVEKII